MSKMADIAQQLDEQCVGYGFASYVEALEQGFTYEVDKQGVAKLIPPSDGLEMAHKAWLKERDEVLGGLLNLMVHNVYDYDTVIKAYNFIKEQCHD